MTRQIVIDCLTCGHAAAIPESVLPDYGLPEDASLVIITKRLHCVECGGRAVKAYRQEAEVAHER